MKIKKSQFRELYFIFEDIASALDHCHLRSQQRALVNSKISNFRRAVIALHKKRTPKRASSEAQNKQ